MTEAPVVPAEETMPKTNPQPEFIKKNGSLFIKRQEGILSVGIYEPDKDHRDEDLKTENIEIVHPSTDIVMKDGSLYRVTITKESTDINKITYPEVSDGKCKINGVNIEIIRVKDKVTVSINGEEQTLDYFDNKFSLPDGKGTISVEKKNGLPARIFLTEKVEI